LHRVRTPKGNDHLGLEAKRLVAKTRDAIEPKPALTAAATSRPAIFPRFPIRRQLGAGQTPLFFVRRRLLCREERQDQGKRHFYPRSQRIIHRNGDAMVVNLSLSSL